MNNFIFFVKSGNDSITDCPQVFFESVKNDCHENAINISELLAVTSADGLNIEQVFNLYIKAHQWADSDVFYVKIPEGEPGIINPE